jgi:YD repeat-containing protein
MKIQTAILGAPLTTGVGSGALTVTVADVSGKIATHTVSFTRLPRSPSTLSYDANGNLAAVRHQLGYDAENRFVATGAGVTLP